MMQLSMLLQVSEKYTNAYKFTGVPWLKLLELGASVTGFVTSTANLPMGGVLLMRPLL